MSDLKGEGLDGLLEEGHRAGGGLVVLDSQVHPARAAVDRDKQEALAGDTLPVPQLAQVLHIDMHEAQPVLLEGSIGFAGAALGRQPAEALRLQDAVDRVAVQEPQAVRDHESEVIERKASRPARRADDGSLLLTCFPGQLMRSSRAVLASFRTPLAPLADRLRRDAVAPG